MSQGGTPYPEGTYSPQPINPFGHPQYINVPQGNYYSMHPMYNVGNNMMGGPQGPSSHFSSPWLESRASNTLPFLEILDIPNLNELSNDPIFHN